MDGMSEGENKPCKAASAGDSGPPGHSRAVKVLVILLVVGVLLAVALPFARVYRQRRAVERVKKLGGSVVYDYQYRGGKLNLVATPPGPELLRRWVGDDAFATVECVNLGGSLTPGTTALTDADSDVLLSFPQLTVLQIASETVGDGALEVAGQLGNLETLSLISGNFSDSGLERLAGLKHLCRVWMHGSKITDKGLDCLAGNKGLRHLVLGDTRVTTGGIARQPFASTLESLTFYGASVNDATLAGLDSLTGLKSFDLTSANVTDAGLAPLTHLIGLRTLSLMECPAITDRGLTSLRGLRDLDELSIAVVGESFTDAAIEQLGGLRNLRRLTLWSVPLGDRAAKAIGGLSKLRALQLVGRHEAHR